MRRPIRPKPMTFTVPADGDWHQALLFADGHTEAVTVPLTDPTVEEIVAYTFAVAERLATEHGAVVGLMPRGGRFVMASRGETIRLQGGAN